MYHKLLHRQIQKHLGNEELSEKILNFLSVINASYDHFDHDRVQLERAIEISSAEMIELYAKQTEANESLRALFDNIDEVFFTIDFTESKLLLISPTCEKIFGYTSKDFFSNNSLWNDMVVDEDRSVFSNLTRELKRGKTVELEYRICAKDGRIKWVKTKLVTSFIKKPRMIKIHGVTTDISIKKEQELTILENEYRFRTIIQSSYDLIQSINIDGKFEFVNDSWLKTLEYKPEELPKLNSYDIVHPEYLESYKQTYQEVLNGKSVSSFKTVFMSKDGREILLEGNATPRFLNEKVVGSQVFFRNITSQERIEKEKTMLVNILKRSEEKFRSLFYNAIDPIFLIDDEQSFFDCNDAAIKAVGAKDKSEVILRKPINFSPKYQPDGQLSSLKSKEMDRIAMELGSNQFEWMYQRIDKTLFPVDVTITAVPMEGKNVLLVHWRDISERKQAEETLKKQNQELQKTNSELDRFVYSVSHDLRAPLSSMLGVIAIALEDTSESFTVDSLNMIKSSANKLDSFIQDILSYSRNSRVAVRNSEVNVKELVAETTENLKFMSADFRLIKIQVHVTGNSHVLADRSRLSIILNNLMSNAIRYQNKENPEPWAKIEIDVTEKEMVIRVSDNGIGINKDSFEKIFEMFYRLSEKSVGSGLGLYIVNEVVQAMKGSISLQSEVGIGSTFTVVLPINEDCIDGLINPQVSMKTEIS